MASNNKQPNEMSFLEHLEELRWHIIRSLVAVLLVAIVIFLLGKSVFDYVILAPKQEWFLTYRLICQLGEVINWNAICFSPPDFVLETRQLGEQFFVHLKVSFILGFIVAFPYVFWEFWRFVKPGLYEVEKRVVRGVVFVCSLLFLMGVSFGYFIISPFAVTFLAGYDIGAVSAPTLASYVSYMAMFTLPAGLVFELPVVVYFLAKLGIVSADFMKTYRRHAFVTLLLLAAIITPPDFVTQLLIGIPLYFLYETSILIARRIEKKRMDD